MKFRDAIATDDRRIESLRVRAWQEAYAGLVDQSILDAMDPDNAANLAVWRNLIDKEGGFAFVQLLESDAGELFGFVAVAAPSRDDDEPEGVAEIVGGYVSPNHFRAGVGQRLLGHTLERLKSEGWREVTNWAIDGNERGIDMLEHFGFVADGKSRKDESVRTTVRRWRLSLS